MSRVQSAILPSALLASIIIGLLAMGLPFGSIQVAPNSLSYSLETNSPDIVQADSIDCPVSSRFPRAVLRWCEIIARHALENELDPDLVAALMLQESSGEPQAYSSNGAVGLLQVMPSDGLAAGFMCANGPCFAGRPRAVELEDPEFNVAYGTRMLAELVEDTGSLREALLHYGPIDVGYAYADTVIQIWEKYR